MSNNVIKFPVEEVKAKAEKARQERALPAPFQRWKSGLALASVVFVMMLINGSDLSTGPAQNYVGEPSAALNGRVIASVDNELRDTAWEYRLAKYLSSRAPRGVASRGLSSGGIKDEMTANFNQYVIRFADTEEGVLSIELPKGSTVGAIDYDGDQPLTGEQEYKGKTFGEEQMVSFLKKYKSLIVSGLADLQPLNDQFKWDRFTNELGHEVYQIRMHSPSKSSLVAVRFSLKDQKLVKLMSEPLELTSVE